MIFYFLPFVFLTILTLIESSKRFKFIINNKYLYYLIATFFIFFIGLRYEVGCDWQQYIEMFEKYNSITLSGLIERNFFSDQKLQELGHIFITRISKNIYVLNLIYAALFSLPLFYFCSKLKSKYFSLLISYPYYIIVVGMGPIRQAACTSFLMISIIYLSNKKYYRHLFLTVISLLIHQFSIFFNGLILLASYPRIREIKFSKINIFFIIIFTSLLIYCSPVLIHKIYVYFAYYKKTTPNGVMIIPPAKSAIILWIINFIPSFIFLKNKNFFKINNILKSIFTSFCILEILLLPIVLVQSVVGYRLLLYLFPSSIYITSLIPEINLFNIKKTYTLNFIISISFISLIVWLKFAYHSSCWVPYKNILFY